MEFVGRHVAEGSGGKLRPAGGDRQRTEHCASKAAMRDRPDNSGRSCFLTRIFLLKYFAPNPSLFTDAPTGSEHERRCLSGLHQTKLL